MKWKENKLTREEKSQKKGRESKRRKKELEKSKNKGNKVDEMQTNKKGKKSDYLLSLA